MRSRLSIVFFLGFALIDAAPVAAQQAEPVTSRRVRVITRSLPREQQFGRIVSAGNDSVEFRPEGSPFRVSLSMSDIERLDVSQGIHRHPGRGALVGLAVGAIGGAIAGASSYRRGCSEWCISRGGLAGIGGVFFGLVGTATGAIVGVFVQTEEWGPLILKPGSGRTSAGKRTFGFQLSHAF